jgi:hypothetical protein
MWKYFHLLKSCSAPTKERMFRGIRFLSWKVQVTQSIPREWTDRPLWMRIAATLSPYARGGSARR